MVRVRQQTLEQGEKVVNVIGQLVEKSVFGVLSAGREEDFGAEETEHAAAAVGYGAVK